MDFNHGNKWPRPDPLYASLVQLSRSDKIMCWCMWRPVINYTFHFWQIVNALNFAFWCTMLRLGRSSCFIWTSYASFERSSWVEFKYVTFLIKFMRLRQATQRNIAKQGTNKAWSSKETVGAANKWAIGSYCQRTASNKIGNNKNHV